MADYVALGADGGCSSLWRGLVVIVFYCVVDLLHSLLFNWLWDCRIWLFIIDLIIAITDDIVTNNLTPIQQQNLTLLPEPQLIIIVLLILLQHKPRK